MTSGNLAVFLDRDGVINVDYGYGSVQQILILSRSYRRVRDFFKIMDIN